MKHLSSLATLGALVLSATTVSGIPAAHAQVNGEEKCSPDGYVMQYSSTLNSWFKQAARCSSSSGSRNDNGNSNSNSQRRATNENPAGNGQPEDGDQKCSAGHVLEYHRYQVIQSGWQDTYRSC